MEYFEKNIEPKLIGYKIEKFFFEDGDFGDLYQFDLENSLIYASVSFWINEVLDLEAIAKDRGGFLINILLFSDQKYKHIQALKQFEEILLEWQK